MPVPEEVRVGPHTYRVVCDQAAIDRKSAEAGSRLIGAFRQTELSFTIDPDLEPTVEREVVLHELLHALLREEDVSEEVVGRLAPSLLAAVRDNPALAAYLAE